MSFARNLLGTTLGRKCLMAATGFVLIVFVTGHLIGNLQVFEEPDRINGYAYFLHSLGPVLWIERLVLLSCVVIHIWAATTLAVEERRARGHEPYRARIWIEAPLASRYMRWTGYVVLAFLLYHLAHFTLGAAQPSTFKENLPPYVMREDYRVAGIPVVHAGTTVPDVHSMVILGFQNPVVSVFYILAVGLLSVHLLHGVESLFQTFGWRNSRWSKCLRRIAAAFCLIYFLGNLLIPGSVLVGAKSARLAGAPALIGEAGR